MPLKIENNGNLVRLIMNRPESKNKLSLDLINAFLQALDEPECLQAQAVTIESPAPDIFAAGADMHALLTLDRERGVAFARKGQSLMNRIAGHPRPVLALVAGSCFGGAFDLAMSCHQIWAADNARFCHPGSRLGIMTGWGGTVRLPQRISPNLARYLLLTGDQLDAQQAYHAGLVCRFFPDWHTMRAAVTTLVPPAGTHNCQD